MDADYWHTLWHEDRTAFHLPKVNPRLAAHFPTLGLSAGARVFVPLCGKTLDIPWLRDQGCHVTGAELSEKAVRELFEAMDETPVVSQTDMLKLYRGQDLEIYVGDIFDLDRATLGSTDAIYDRAALVALPPEMRARYANHLSDLTDRAPQLLLTFEYDQRQMDGPPFRVDSDEVVALYADRYEIDEVARHELPDGLLSARPAWDVTSLLRPRA